MEDLDYGAMEFWIEYPEFRYELELPEDYFDEICLDETPKKFWGLITCL